MNNTWNDHSDCMEKEYYYDMECCKKQDKCWEDDCSEKHDECWNHDCCKKHHTCKDEKCCKKDDKYWDDKCCKKHDTCWEDKCCKKHDECCDGKCCKKRDECCDGKCCNKHDECWDDECCKKDDKCCGEKCCKKCDCCRKIKGLLKDAYKYAFRARVAILAIFEFKNPCEHWDVIKYFFCKAKESVKCLFKILDKLCWSFDKKCFRCGYEAAYIIQKAIRNTEAVAYSLCELEELCDPCCNEYEYCESVNLTRVALEKIEDVVREIETLFKLFKKCECKKC